jgi:hypothetical protein
VKGDARREHTQQDGIKDKKKKKKITIPTSK